jgi:hypothetical protein
VFFDVERKHVLTPGTAEHGLRLAPAATA